MCYAEEGTVVYAAGHCLVLLNVDSRAQRFIPCSADGQGVTAVAVCQAKKLLALAERGAERAQVTIFDLETLRRKKVLTSGDAVSKVRKGCGEAKGNGAPRSVATDARLHALPAPRK